MKITILCLVDAEYRLGGLSISNIPQTKKFIDETINSDILVLDDVMWQQMIKDATAPEMEKFSRRYIVRPNATKRIPENGIRATNLGVAVSDATSLKKNIFIIGSEEIIETAVREQRADRILLIKSPELLESTLVFPRKVLSDFDDPYVHRLDTNERSLAHNVLIAFYPKKCR